MEDALQLNNDFSKIDKDGNILIFDDIYDNGYTLNAAAKLLRNNGCKNIYVFTLTRTRNPQ